MRKKTKQWKRTSALAACAVMFVASTAGGVATLPARASSYSNTYNVELSKSFQEFDGWGLSLSWWATEIGDWTRTGSSGMSKRDEVMEAIYGKTGLNLNIARYNVGGGDDPAHTHMTDDRNTPGWRGATTQDVDPAAETTVPEGSFLSDDKTKLYTPNSNYVFEQEDGSTLSWEKTPDWRQLWVLDWIQNHREEDLITEYYSNSPPYWMTRTGCSSGGVNKGTNLVNDEAHNKAFVEYFLDVYEYLVAQGFQLDNLQPFNESGSTYWGLNGDQEGSFFNAEHKVEILSVLIDEMKERGLEVPYNWGDETNTNVAMNEYNAARKLTATNGMTGTEITDGADRITYHIYDRKDNTMMQLYRSAKSHGQELYMSEICYTEGSEYDPNAMDTGFKYTQSIIDTVKYGGVDAYVFWQGVEDMVGQIKSGTNYGLIQGVYYTQEEAEAQGTDLAAMGLNYQDFVLSKAYYMSGQYTKYINKGYKIIDIDDDGSMAAVSPDGQTLVVVKQNKNKDAESFKLNLGGFKADSVEKIYTDKTHNWAKDRVSTDGDSMIDTVSGSSVTTYVIHGARTGRAGYFIDDSEADMSCTTVEEIKAKMEELGETEQFYGTYNIADNDCNKNSYFGSSYTNQQKWMAFRFQGTGFGLTFPQKHDAGDIAVWVDADPTGTATAEVSLKKDNQINKGIVYERTDLAEGWHTVYVKSVSGWVNFDGAFVYTAKDAETDGKTLAVTNALGLGDQIKFDYTAEGYDGYEIYAETRVAGENWNRSSALTGGKAMLTVNANKAELRLAAVKGDATVYSPVQIVNVLETKEGVLYFVDAGTSTPDMLSTGAVLGELQSVSDQKFGADAFSGKSWGYTNTLKSGKSEVGFYGVDEAMSSIMALENLNQNNIEYKFTIPTAGTYKVALGFFGGGSSWGTRDAVVTIGTNAAQTVHLREQAYASVYADVTTTGADEVITISVTNNSHNTFLSLIAITESDVKLPLYTDTQSNLNMYTAATAKQVVIGDDLYSEVNKTNFTVYFSDGSTATYNANDKENVSCTVKTGLITPGTSMTTTLKANAVPEAEAFVEFVWSQEGAIQLYYNIDCGYVDEGGTPPEDATQLGSKQSSTRDRQFGPDSKGASWGYVGNRFNDGVNWRNDGSNEWSIREALGGTLTYKMTGFKPNEALKMMTGGHCADNWGGRTYTVSCNGTEVGEVELKNGQRTYETFTEGVQADENGELTVTYVKKTGDNPQVGYIKIWSTGENLAKDTTITSDKSSVARNDKVTLRNLNTQATVYILDENNAVLGSFKPTEASQQVKVSDYLPENSYSMHFVQATANVTNVSSELVVDVPDVDVLTGDEWTKDGDATAVLFKPHAAHGVTSLTITTPDKMKASLTDGFFFRAKVNGEYKVTLVSNGVTVEKTFEVKNIDEFELEKTYSAPGWTKDPVTVTLTPIVGSGVASVEIDGAAATAQDGKYTITATENGTHTVKVVSNAGNVYEETVVIDKIDTTAPVLDLAIDFSAANGVALGYDANSLSGGKLYVTLNDGAKTEITENGAFSLDREGKYVITFTNGAGVTTAEQVYYVTYGTQKSVLATVSVGEDGTVSVSEKARAASAKLYRAGESTAISSMKAEKAGKYYLELENNGEKEVVVFNVSKNLDNGGSDTGIMIAGIVIGCVALVAAAVVCTVLVVKGRKNQ